LHRLKFLSGTTVAMSALAIGLMVAIGIAGLPVLRRGLLPGGAQGASLLPGPDHAGAGPLPGRPTEEGTSQAFGPLAGTGPLQAGGPLLGAGPLQGGAPLVAGFPIGGSGIPGGERVPVTAVTLAAWTPDGAMPLDLAPVQWRDDPAPPGAPAPTDSPASICVTCFIPPAPPAPTPPANNISPCSNVTCN
jgi:hypothetical protein